MQLSFTDKTTKAALEDSTRSKDSIRLDKPKLPLPQENRSFIQVSDAELQSSNTVKLHDIESDSPAQPPLGIYTYSDASGFTQKSSRSALIQNAINNNNPPGNIQPTKSFLMKSN